MDADKKDGEPHKAPSAVGQDVQRPGIGVVVAVVDDHIQAKPAMGCNRLVKRGKQDGQVRLEVGALPSRA